MSPALSSGYQTALSLCEAGAHVILACRDTVKAGGAVARILQSKVSRLMCEKFSGTKHFFVMIAAPLHCQLFLAIAT